MATAQRIRRQAYTVEKHPARPSNRRPPAEQPTPRVLPCPQSFDSSTRGGPCQIRRFDLGWFLTAQEGKRRMSSNTERSCRERPPGKGSHRAGGAPTEGPSGRPAGPDETAGHARELEGCRGVERVAAALEHVELGSGDRAGHVAGARQRRREILGLGAGLVDPARQPIRLAEAEDAGGGKPWGSWGSSASGRCGKASV
jgi:hypothetical protein